MEPLIILTPQPGKRQPLLQLAYSGSILLRWQITLESAGVNPLSLKAAIEAEQTFNPIGFISRGSWGIPGGDRLNAPLAEVPYNPLYDWFVIAPNGFKNSQLFIYPYQPATYQIMGTVNNPPVGFGQPPIDLSPVVNAIDSLNSTTNNNDQAILGQLDRVARAVEPGSQDKMIEFKSYEWGGSSNTHIAIGRDMNRKTLTVSVPEKDDQGNPNLHLSRISTGDQDRIQQDDYDYVVYPGGSVSFGTDEAVQQVCIWQDPGVNPLTMVNVSFTFN